MRQIITAVLLIFLGIVLVLALCFTDYKMLVVGSNSMNDYLAKGDIIIAYKDDFSNLEVGDVIVFKHENVDVIHRIVEIKNEDEIVLSTKGDNNEVADGWNIKEDDYIGKVIFKVKCLGYPTVWINELIKGD